ncbi:MAG TPA: GAF domain-containing sensor histidine kinase [Candidatus Dormibacteraeota bacterium]
MEVSASRAERLLETGLALAAELSLPALLQRIIDLAAEVTGARYGALGVLSTDGTDLSDFITTGMSPAQRAAIGALPRGEGILGVLIREPELLRLRSIAAHPRSFGFPPDHPPMQSFLGAPIRAHGRVFGNIYLTDKNGADEFTEDDASAVLVLATQAGVAIANAQLYAELRLRERWLDSVREVATTLLAGDTPKATLQLVARHARELGDADMSTISIPDAGGLRIIVADGVGEAELLNVEVPLVGSLSAEVIRTERTMLVADAGKSTLTQPMVSIAGVGPMILVPLALRTSSAGVLAVGRRAGRPIFTAADVPLLESFAEQASLALEYARALAEVSRLGLVEDRERIARDLHDGVIQSLFAVGLGLQGTAALVGDTRLADRIQQYVTEIDRVIGDVRSYIFGLRPSVLMPGNLTNTIEQLAHEMQERTGVIVVADIDISLESALADVAAQIAHIVREALSNVGRHAGATTCRVTIRRDGDVAVVEVDDDGRGFDIAQAHRGMGMGNLDERAQSIHGTLDVVSEPGQGTVIRLTIPL